MANKDLFKQAIAEAKSVREAAIANAKEALEETLTPHLKDMLAAKLQEMEDSSVEEEVNEAHDDEKDEAMHPKKKDEAMHSKKKDEAHSKDDDMDEAHGKDKDMDEAMDDEKDEAYKKDDAMDEAPKDDDKAMEEAEDDSEESEDEADAEDHGGDTEEPEGDEDISNLSVDQFKDMIRDIIAQEVGGDAPADDMDAGDIEGMGDEPAMDAEPEMAGDEEEIDLDELIGELEAISEEEVEEGKKEDMDEAPGKEKKHMKEAPGKEKKHMKEAPGKKKDMDEAPKKDKDMDEDVSNQVNAQSDGADYNINRVSKLQEDATENKSELDQALETIETLQKELNEVNILNAKLLYVNKIFKANNLTESQKVNVIAAFDKAETVKEVKLVYETVADNVGTKKETTIKEHKGSASKATGVTAKKPEVISEVSSAVQRMQKLAGIIK